MANRIYCLLIVAICCVLLPAHAQELPTAPKFLPTGELRVGINPVQPPLIFVKEKRVAGLEADFARAFATDLGVPLNFVVMDWDELIPALVEGKIDIIMSGMTATELRAVRINFVTPYLATGQMPLVRVGDVSRYPTTMALKYTQVRVGVEEGTTGDFLVRENFLYAERVSYDNIQDAAVDLSNGDLGMVVYDAPTVWWLASEDGGSGLSPLATVLTNEYIAWGVSKTNPEMKLAAEAFLRNLQSNGELAKMLELWVPFVGRPASRPAQQAAPAPERTKPEVHNPDRFQGGAR
ncbi:transporter substrate-binding domain-containing protein [Cerasicoccus frondis]|uniref:transporter substrate-binding domain-containing protein n=1 Tax=Cerasicoccus frondis TaxID=490090 RepID=UPI002852745C|nr:transporter substrate-binding domain-containing protein [Cerasicoccus frondis]